jgi:hypothetical protein
LGHQGLPLGFLNGLLRFFPLTERLESARWITPPGA